MYCILGHTLAKNKSQKFQSPHLFFAETKGNFSKKPAKKSLVQWQVSYKNSPLLYRQISNNRHEPTKNPHDFLIIPCQSSNF